MEAEHYSNGQNFGQFFFYHTIIQETLLFYHCVFFIQILTSSVQLFIENNESLLIMMKLCMKRKV